MPIAVEHCAMLRKEPKQQNLCQCVPPLPHLLSFDVLYSELPSSTNRLPGTFCALGFL